MRQLSGLRTRRIAGLVLLLAVGAALGISAGLRLPFVLTPTTPRSLSEVVLASPTISLGNGFPTGGVRGTVRIESKIQPRSLAVNLYSRRGGPPIPAKPSAPASERENVVLYLEGDFKTDGLTASLPRGDESVIRQVNETFVPHVLPIQSGSTVYFPNGDPFFHNVFSLSGAKSFDLGRYPKGQVRSVKFSRPGIVKLFCHIHSHMNAVIVVFDHPYFCVADAKGAFVMARLPAGQHTVVAWHERLKPQKKTVRVEPGENSTVDFVL